MVGFSIKTGPHKFEVSNNLLSNQYIMRAWIFPWVNLNIFEYLLIADIGSKLVSTSYFLYNAIKNGFNSLNYGLVMVCSHLNKYLAN